MDIREILTDLFRWLSQPSEQSTEEEVQTAWIAFLAYTIQFGVGLGIAGLLAIAIQVLFL